MVSMQLATVLGQDLPAKRGEHASSARERRRCRWQATDTASHDASEHWGSCVNIYSDEVDTGLTIEKTLTSLRSIAGSGFSGSMDVLG